MSDKIGDISMDDIMAAAMEGLDDDDEDVTAPVRQEPVAKAAPQVSAQVRQEPVAKPAAKAEPVAKAEPKVNAPVKPEPVAKAAPQVNAPVRQESAAKPAAKAEPATKTVSQVNAPVKPEPVAKVAPQVNAPVKQEPAAKPAAKTEPVAQANSQTTGSESFPSNFFAMMKRCNGNGNGGAVVWCIIDFIVCCAALWGWIPYIFLISRALSDKGQIRIQKTANGYIPDDMPTKSRIEKIFRKVYDEALAKDPTLSKNIKWFLVSDPSWNAYAIGRETICLTEGLLSLDDDKIAGIMSHEFGHISHRDTDVSLALYYANLAVSVSWAPFVIIFSLCAGVVFLFMDIFTGIMGDKTNFAHNFFRVVSFVTTKFPLVWGNLGKAVCVKGSHQMEFDADKFAYEIGNGEGLSDALVDIDSAPRPVSFFKFFSLTHPNTTERVAKLSEYSM